MMFTNENDGYDAADNTYGCWKLATRMLRLDEIKAGRAMPRLDDAEEMEVAREAGFQIIEASAHRRSA
jgi:hypothetical protein